MIGADLEKDLVKDFLTVVRGQWGLMYLDIDRYLTPLFINRIWFICYQKYGK